MINLLSDVWEWMTPAEQERWRVLDAQNTIITDAWQRTQSDKLATDLAYIASEMAQIEARTGDRRDAEK